MSGWRFLYSFASEAMGKLFRPEKVRKKHPTKNARVRNDF